jgi:hypothetical protein
VDACLFPRDCFGLWCVVLLSMLVFSLVVAVSTFEQRIVRRYNNTHCTYGVNLKHEGSISELHCAAKIFSTFFLQTIIGLRARIGEIGKQAKPSYHASAVLRRFYVGWQLLFRRIVHDPESCFTFSAVLPRGCHLISTGFSAT